MKNTTDQKLDIIVDSIESVLKDLDSESGYKQHVTEYIILQTIIWGSMNPLEALGILEHCKDKLKNLQDSEI